MSRRSTLPRAVVPVDNAVGNGLLGWHRYPIRPPKSQAPDLESILLDDSRMRGGVWGLLVVVGCTDHSLTEVPGHDCVELGRCSPSNVYVDFRTELDVLFVVDNSSRMLAKQRQLGVAFPSFLDVLDQTPSGRPDLRIGVVSSNMGSLGVQTGDPTCDGGGDRGNLQVPDGCPVAGSFLVGSDDPDRQVHYAGTLDDAVACMTALGEGGCGFEQHLEAMRAALSPDHVVNAGFLRYDAALAVVILADEDDC